MLNLYLTICLIALVLTVIDNITPKDVDIFDALNKLYEIIEDLKKNHLRLATFFESVINSSIDNKSVMIMIYVTMIFMPILNIFYVYITLNGILDVKK